MRCPNCGVPYPFSENRCQSCGISLAATRLRIVALAALAVVVLVTVGVFLS